jgi:paraquat-inducible protein B
VTEVGLDIDSTTKSLRGRVEIVAFPERLVERLGQQTAAGEAIARSTQQRRAFFERMVEQRGLRVQLRSGSLLTGQLFVALDFFPDAPKAKVDWSQEKPVLPTVPSTITDLEAKLSGILAKLDKLPYEAIGADVTKALGTLNATLQGASTTLNRLDADVTPELKATLEELRRVIATVDGVLKDGVSPTLTGVTATLEELRRPLATADAVLKNTDATLLGRGAPVQQDLRDALQEITLAARSLRVLMDYLDRHPDALIRGKTQEKP